MIRKLTSFSATDDLELDCFHSLEGANFADEKFVVGDEVFCPSCDNLTFPEGLSHVRDTPEFNQDSIPKGFLKAHSTKKGTWGKIVVDSGMLNYVIDDLEDKLLILDEDTVGIIPPNMIHHVSANWDVSFHVSFYTKDVYQNKHNAI